ncbi:hypothetical protein LUX33_19525 [Actinomadura madurae]|uniref:hypothetical protein n=1 Tax=Actinomadura madurae TaxID=1993 RepID=UPI0020D25C70|nr:hypothetical protein [Actinomadura madurae]MCP9950376.1 hypothetical protein [Actinomadura madurae]
MTLIVGAVMGQRSPSAADAVNTAEGILVAAERALVAKPLARRGDVVGRIDDGLDGSTALRATAPVAVVGWPGLTVRVGYDGDPPADAAPGDAAAPWTRARRGCRWRRASRRTGRPSSSG